mmetsp:Transcript_66721/g.77435  ORF Transcript_66721/g.77435 Transcript_66721/m.77435 type:complete len:535 (+) Transcript_66721:27-1631(+)|eukprot:CAMPEP_0176433182 /NCGR_PEP_ID=MMETSP0127-20121128/15852_1 /TAXON_ID=938130 /ORGANISM="Platyophrya macrostoma, Strain WH" /LENGTH=534 /DNA_ID=CAMNT_0017815525 /DNA_START=17 /DNA_END=1621 /DNA_ORIENTATION=+
MKLCVFLLAVCVVALADDPAYLRNIGKVFSGYDLIKANPDPINEYGGIDPGFRRPIFKTEYEDDVTSDYRYKVPKGVDIDSILNCQLNFDTKIIFGSSSYSDSVKSKMSVDFKGWFNSAFKASRDYQEVNERTTQDEMTYTKSDAVCEVYQIMVRQFLPPPLSDEFKIAVSKLNGVYDANSPGIYLQFINYFGTHYFNSVRLGGKYGQQSEIKNTSWTSLTKSSLNIEASASFSALGASLAGSYMSEEQKSMARSFSQYTSKQRLYTLGTPIPADGKAETWGSSCINDPQVVYYGLTALSELITPDFFPNDTLIQSKKTNLEAALGDYCNQLLKQGLVKDCNPPTDPKRNVVNNFGGMYQVDDCGRDNVANGMTGGLYCPQGFTPVSQARLKAPESGCGAVQTYCIDRTLSNQGGSFGGMYQITDGNIQRNPNHEAEDRYACPTNTTSYFFQRVYDPEYSRGSNVYICLGAFVPGRSQIGGFYQLLDTSKAGNTIVNPYTNSPSCPQNYKPIPVGRIKSPENGDGANSYICILA